MKVDALNMATKPVDAFFEVKGKWDSHDPAMDTL